MTSVVVGLVSPGEMGSALGLALRTGGAEVVTTLQGRSSRSAGFAVAAGLTILPDLAAVLRTADIVLSVVPPAQARAVATEVAELCTQLGCRPLLADLNAISPVELRALADDAAAVGLEVVDGALSGAPPGTGSSATRLLLAGPAASRVAELPWSPMVLASVLDGGLGAASAAKMCTGGVRKGLSALVINALLTAQAHDVLDTVVDELERALGRDPVPDAALAASKAWRFVAEMEAVAITQDDAGLDPALYRAVAEVFGRTAHSPLADRRPEDVERSHPARGVDGTEGVDQRRRAVSSLWPRPDENHAQVADPSRAHHRA